MKKAIMVVMALALSAAAYGQAPPPGAPNKPEAQKETPKESSTAAASPDRNFVTKTAVANMAEVSLGKFAQGKAEQAEVKKFAQMMVEDHSKAGAGLKAIAANKDIKLPTDLDHEHKALQERLSKLSGAAFDQAYVDAMVNGHRKVAAAFRSESKSGRDPEVKDWASKTLPTIEAHLKQAEDLKRTVTPAAGSNSTR
jgi:putative membrane protein